MEKNIYKEAILDAKAIRASAIANAKMQIQETIEPKIQEMMRLKLSEELEEEIEEDLEEAEDMEEGMDMKHSKDSMEESYEEMEESEITEASLDEILAELDSIEEGEIEEAKHEEEKMEEGYDKMEEADEMEEGYEIEESDDMEEAKEDDEAEEEAEEETEEPAEDEGTTEETKIIDITVGDLKDVLKSVMAQSQSLDADAEVPDMGGEDMDGKEEGGALSLDEILAELEEEGYDHGHQTDAAGAAAVEEGKGTIPGFKTVKAKTATVNEKKVEDLKKELEEANNAIQSLRESLNDINLLNAKLLYMNKIFKAKSLTESEKIKVIKAFDRSTSVKEVKNTYHTLNESIGTNKKGSMNESIGFASKPIGTAPKSNIVESNDFVSRWQKIAGIK